MQEEHFKSSVDLRHGLFCLRSGKIALRGARRLESAKQSVVPIIFAVVLLLFSTAFTLPYLEQIIYDISLISAFIRVLLLLFTCQSFVLVLSSELGCLY